MKHKAALRRHRGRQDRKLAADVARAVLTSPQPPFYKVEKETERLYGSVFIDRETLIIADPEYVRHRIDKSLAYCMGAELLKHAKVKMREEEHGRLWLASVEVVK